MTDHKVGENPTSAPADIKKKALEVLYGHKIALWSMTDVRNCVLSGNIERGISLIGYADFAVDGGVVRHDVKRNPRLTTWYRSGIHL